MFLAEPPRTAWDLNFSVLGFSVRVHPFFWLMCLMLGGANDATHILMVTAIFFGSILIHELGHTFMMRRYGREAHIVLYGMGGLAIEGSNNEYSGYYHPRGERRTAQEQIYISLAGPVAQLLLAGAMLALVKLLGGETVVVMQHKVVPNFVVLPSAQISAELASFLFIALQVNVGWALMNLLPVYPLDGGQIAMQLFMLRDSEGGMVRALQLSIAVAVSVVLFALVTMGGDGWYLMLLFGSLGVSNYFMYMQIFGQGGRGGRW
ncbi:Peptidase family M50 [Anatilimnocola aggregata]|uniref:Peptidase family M50 n=1 Tax=Anatilimnocola aggregata TaxID=2528021 RepID=A0A517YG39_9BACT|nr:site-2 protease family protein [Anatilimnocola aggregata]QDU29196.1 Peptidase family M50 [Anatilimnocola aggregata]